MYWSRTLIPTSREAPADADSISHQLMIRAGLIRRVSAGVYDWLPLGWRSMLKINAIIREEMNAIAAEEIHLPALLPADWWKQTGRYLDYGALLFKLKDRKGAEIILGPTHEECVTELVQAYISSHKQLPITLYQIQSKFRDEARPRSGMLRVREFFMKDAYSFHSSLESLNTTYLDMYNSYVRIFKRCGIAAIPVEAESGPIGGDASHEFICPCDAGEDIIVHTPDYSWAANLERAGRGPAVPDFSAAPDMPAAELEKVPTPDTASIDAVCQLLNIPATRMLKTMVFRGGAAQAGKWIVACVRGDHEINTAKIQRIAGPVELADEATARAAGFAIGYVGPHITNTITADLIIDPDALLVANATSGANEPNWHVRNFNWKQHLAVSVAQRAIIADIRNVTLDDKAPNGEALIFSKGIELGHVFKLGTKYSQALGATYLDDKQQSHHIIMGCYGIGPGRIMVGALETLSDRDGIRWPMAIAPFHVIITPIKYEGRTREIADRLQQELSAGGIDVLVDDRDQRPGVKFKDADLIGIPLRIVLGDKGLAVGQAELKTREKKEPELISLEHIVPHIITLVRRQLSAPG
ncbi:MAG: proline--tRNA ligase [Phycisphaerae bacterium]